MTEDTIAAIATAPGEGGVSIVRMSGPEAESIMMRLFRPAGKAKGALASHMLTYGRVMDGGMPVDECMAVVMRAPRSYTREDVCEFQLHGGGYACHRVLDMCLAAGARLAEPGEFTRRAFLNGRIDLSQAEAVMALISARGEQAHRAAMRQLDGGASLFIRQAADELYGIQAGVAACIDYPEEVDEAEAAADLSPRISRLRGMLTDACDERAARLTSAGLTVALCGRPNVGKSSLLNALLGEDRAIVTEIPGTTRDTVPGDLVLGGCLIHLTDTAGIRDTDDPVEKLGVARSAKALDQADAVVLVLDGGQPLQAEDRALIERMRGRNVLVALNKSDLPSVVTDDDAAALLPGAPVFRLSARDTASLMPLKARLQTMASVTDQLALTQPRHLDAARRAAAHLGQALDALSQGMSVDFVSVDLQAAQAALSEITGDRADEKLLDQVFSSFCVGK